MLINLCKNFIFIASFILAGCLLDALFLSGKSCCQYLLKAAAPVRLQQIPKARLFSHWLYPQQLLQPRLAGKE
jgi:hypothetical protein